MERDIISQFQLTLFRLKLFKQPSYCTLALKAMIIANARIKMMLLVCHTLAYLTLFCSASASAHIAALLCQMGETNNKMQRKPGSPLMCNVSAYLQERRNKKLFLTIHHPTFLSTVTPFSARAKLWWLNVGHESQLFDSYVAAAVSLALLCHSVFLQSLAAALPLPKSPQIKGTEGEEHTLC